MAGLVGADGWRMAKRWLDYECGNTYLNCGGVL
jgi:hypothetical protein